MFVFTLRHELSTASQEHPVRVEDRMMAMRTLVARSTGVEDRVHLVCPLMMSTIASDLEQRGQDKAR